MRYGGSMLWWLYPGFRPFIDGRGDAYSEEFWKSEYFPIMNVRPGWTNVLAKFDAHGLLLFLPPDRKIPPLLQAVHENPDWALVAFDDNALLYLQRTAQNSGVIARNEFRLLWPGDWSLNALDAPETRAAAVEEAGRAAAQSPDSLFAATAFARACLVTDQFDKAAETLRRLLAENDLGENYYRDFGFALFRLGRFRESDKVFATMIRRDMLRGFAFFMRHHIALREGRIPNAREYLEKALAAEPKNEEYRAALERLNTPAQPSP
jgi:tetratricopeptide (TPR) repeat protein